MQSRRAFLKSGSRVFAVLALLKWPGSGPAAYAYIAPAVVGSVLETAISVVGLFSHGGASIADLLHLQAELLKQISAELAVINKWAERISEQLNEIEELLGKIPQQVVLEINKTDIAASITGAGEVQQAFYEIANSSEGLDVAKSSVDSRLKTHLRELQKARLSIMQPQFETLSLIPTICAAAYAETWMMIMLEENPRMIRITARAYLAWLKKLSVGRSIPSLSSKIYYAEVAHHVLSTDITRKPRDFECIDYTRLSEGPSKFRVIPKFTPDYAAFGSFGTEEEIDKLVNLGILKVTEIPEKYEDSFEQLPRPKVERAPDFSQNAAAEEERKRQEWLHPAPGPNLNKCDLEKEGHTKTNNRKLGELNEWRFQLVCLRALKRAATDAIKYLEDLIAKLEEQIR